MTKKERTRFVGGGGGGDGDGGGGGGGDGRRGQVYSRLSGDIVVVHDALCDKFGTAIQFFTQASLSASALFLFVSAAL